MLLEFFSLRWPAIYFLILGNGNVGKLQRKEEDGSRVPMHLHGYYYDDLHFLPKKIIHQRWWRETQRHPCIFQPPGWLAAFTQFIHLESKYVCWGSGFNEMARFSSRRKKIRRWWWWWLAVLLSSLVLRCPCRMCLRRSKMASLKSPQTSRFSGGFAGWLWRLLLHVMMMVLVAVAASSDQKFSCSQSGVDVCCRPRITLLMMANIDRGIRNSISPRRCHIV